MLQMSRCIKESCEPCLLKILSFVAQVIAPAVLLHAGAVKLCCSFDFYGVQFRPTVPHHIAGVCPIMQAYRRVQLAHDDNRLQSAKSGAESWGGCGLRLPAQRRGTQWESSCTNKR